MAKIMNISDLKRVKNEFDEMTKKYQYNLHVCFGAGCISSNCKDVKDALVEALKKYNYEDKVLITETGCIGACHLGPSLLVEPGNIYYIKLQPEEMEEIVIKHILGGEIVEQKCYYDDISGKHIHKLNDIPFFEKQKKIVLNNCGQIDFSSIDEYIANDGYLAIGSIFKNKCPEEVVRVVKDSGLRGRGGGGFPTGLKWEFAAKSESEQKYVICNADEGDPGAFMDRSLLEGDPHAVIEGMTIAGYAIGANKGYVYVRAEYPLAVERLNVAIEKAREYGLLSNNIMNSGFSFDIEIRIGAGAFVCGEETALMNSIEGKRGEPRQKPPFPSDKGLFDKPSIINNVETFGSVPYIILYGADWFKTFGTEKSSGTKVFALAGAIHNTGIVEVPMGVTLGDIVYDIGGGIKDGKKFKAAQTGGPSGGCLTSNCLNTPIDYDSLKSKGAIMGSGGLIVMDEDNCMVDVARFFMEFVQEESCGKCVPCRLGTKRMLEILERITQGKGEEGDIEKLIELGETIKETALCGLGQTAPNPVLSTIKEFREEYEEHIRDKKCRAGVCTDLFISPCQNACPAGVNVPGYISLIGANRLRDAYNLIRKDNPFPAVCGRVCTHPCESKCRREQLDEALAIRDLKRYIADTILESDEPFDDLKFPPKGKSIGIIGAGPSGLTCGYYLSRLGYDVTVYESHDTAGGILRYGIPEYRLPRDILQKEIKTIEQAGVKIELNTEVGIDVDFERLRKEHEAVYVATGTQYSNKINVKGENLKGVYHGLDFLKDVNKGKDVKVGKKVAIIGGGNTAIDAARVALRLGAKEIHILYRRNIEDMPAERREVEEALEEGIIIHTLVSPIEIIGEDHVEKIKLVKLEQGNFDVTGRRRPTVIEGSAFEMEFDMIIPAVSQHSDLPFINKDEVEMTKWGTFVVDDKSKMTNIDGVFAGGDVVRGPDTVIWAITDGKEAAISIDKFLGGDGVLNTGKDIEIPKPEADVRVSEHMRFEMDNASPEERKNNFKEISKGFHRLNAIAESMRCLRCDKR
ncbi:NADH-quinone oxidoreductase subunit NuoF [Vallitalea guaymasensis]|nr:NADH-quinone oxidoreductase subunit NuoF [Vallitalea guaymasensis]